MSGVLQSSAAAARIDALLAARREAGEAFFAREGTRIDRLAGDVADRLGRGGRLLALGHAPTAQAAARRLADLVATPATPYERPLTARAIVPDGGRIDDQVARAARPADVAVAAGWGDRETRRALHAAHRRGCLTVAFAAGAHADAVLVPPAPDPFVRRELVAAAWVVVRELIDAGRGDRPPAALRARVATIADAQRATVDEQRDELLAAAATIRGALDGGGRALAVAVGGAAADALGLVADLHAPHAGGPSRPAAALTDGAGAPAAAAPDGAGAAPLARQVAGAARDGDVVVALCRAGDGRAVRDALAAARRAGAPTVALAAPDAAAAVSPLADRLLVARATEPRRIALAHATAAHVLRELTELT